MNHGPARRATRSRFVVALGALSMLAVFGGCGGGGGGGSFSSPDFPVSFDYPSDWTLTQAAPADAGASGEALRALSVALKEPFDQAAVSQYRLKTSLPAGANGFRPEIDRIVKRQAKQVRGMAGRAKTVEFGGAPGYQYVVK